MPAEQEVRGEIERVFPGLRLSAWLLTSRADPRYNCIAWAAHDSQRFWWPDLPYYWPPGTPREVTRAAFLACFASLGFGECDSDVLVPRVEKIALFEKDQRPTHMARQLANGQWSSKLGGRHDISHRLRDLEGPLYGNVAAILCRARV